MDLVIAAAGRLKEGPERALFRRYADRIAPAGRSVGIGALNVVEIGESRRGSANERRAEESAGLLKKIGSNAALAGLETRGEALTSEALARFLAEQREAGQGRLAFVIGGPDGHGHDLIGRADRLLSLGRMTLPHALVRIVLAEQLYRAVTILSGHPYHRG